MLESLTTREKYEDFIRATRDRTARRERIAFRVKAGFIIAGVIVALLGLMFFAEYATAAPLEPKGPDSLFQRGLKEPDASPRKGMTIQDAKNACEQHGGHWFEQEPEEFPQGKIIGCLFLVPKGSK